jgi:hypothetical protein
MGRKRQEKQRSEPQSHGGLKVEVRDQNLREQQEYWNDGETRIQETEDRSTAKAGRLEEPEVKDRRTEDRRQMTTGFAAPTPCQRRQMPETFLPICLPAMANSHDLDGLNLFVNFINDSVIADSNPPVIS